VLGDSYVAAFHVELDSTFLSIAENRLARDQGFDVELLNFGRQGMTQTEEYLILQRDVMRFTPDMVALLFLPQNDVREIAHGTSPNTTRPFPEIAESGELEFDDVFNRSFKYRIRSCISAIRRRSALVSLAVERYTLLSRARRLARVEAGGKTEGGLAAHLTLCSDRQHPAYVHNYKLNKSLIGAMAGFCEERGITFMLMCADFAASAEEEARYQAIDPTFDPDFFNKDLRALADSLDIEYLGFQAPFRRAIRETGDPHHWVHWNYSGHRVAAEAMALRLKEFPH